MKKENRVLRSAGILLAGCLVWTVWAADTDTDGMTDEYEVFFGLNHTNAADASFDPDGDTLTNLQESVFWTDPLVADTDRDGWADHLDNNPLSRAVFLWGVYPFSAGTNYFYTGPAWWGSTFKESGSWTTNGWEAPATLDPNTGALNIEVLRELLTNDVMLDVELFDAANASLYAALCDSNQTLIVSNLYGGSIVTGSQQTVTRRLAIPLSSYSNATFIRLWRGIGDIVIHESLLYIDQDGDGLDADQELQAGTSDLDSDTDGDGYDDGAERLDGSDPTDPQSLPAYANSVFHLPFTETFEAEPGMAGVPGSVDAQHGWSVSGNGSAEVQSNDVFSGGQALSITDASAIHQFTDGQTNVWVSYRLKAMRGTAPQEIPDNPAALFYVNPDGLLCVSSNRQFVTLPVSVPDQWNRCDFHFDFALQTWDMRLNREPVLSAFPFYGSPESFSFMRLDGKGAGTALDDIQIVFENPDRDNDGYTNDEETAAGTDPDNPLEFPGNLLPPPEIELDGATVSVPEGGTAQFGVCLTAEPDQPSTVSVSIVSGDADLSLQSGGEPVFTAENWMDFQYVTLAAAEDADWLTGTAVVRCVSLGLAAVEGVAVEAENDFNPLYTVPFAETFEAEEGMAGVPGALDGQNGWAADDPATVQSNDVFSGEQAVAITDASIIHEFTDGQTNVWVSYQLKALRGSAPENIPADMAAVFYVNTDGLLCAYSNQQCITLPVTVPEGWNQYDFHLDFDSKQWSLRLNREPVFTGFPFYGSPEAFSIMRLDGKADGTALDDVQIVCENPDRDGDGYTNDEEAAAGSDPDNPQDIPDVSVSGTVAYSGSQTGTVCVIASASSNDWIALAGAQLAAPGAFIITTVSAKTELWLKAWLDIDADGTFDLWEPQGTCATGPLTLADPAEGLSIVIEELDRDGDGLPDWQETELGTDPFAADTDGDGLSDSVEAEGSAYRMVPGTFTWAEADADATARGGHLFTLSSDEEHQTLVDFIGEDAFTNSLWIGAFRSDTNSSDWQWTTGEEFIFTRWHYDSPQDALWVAYDAWAQQVWRDVPSWGRFAYILEYENFSDALLADTDNDGLSDGDELIYGCNARVADSDGDTLLDGDEVALGLNPDSTDSDSDGLDDARELELGTDALLADTDSDGLTDGEEINFRYQLVRRYLTWDEAKADAERRGGHLAVITSAEENDAVIAQFGHFWDELPWIGAVQNSADETWSWISDEAFDYTRWSQWVDLSAGSHIYMHGADWMVDISERNRPWLLEHETPLNPLNPDSDGDGLPDGEEITLGTDPFCADTDGDTLGDADEIAHSTDPTYPDSDRDGLTDAEDADPLNPDRDSDGLLDGEEALITLTDPQLSDSDGDSIPDRTLLLSRPGIETVGRYVSRMGTSWSNLNNSVVLENLRARGLEGSYVTYDLTVSENDGYRLAVQLSWLSEPADRLDDLRVDLYVDDQFIDSMTVVQRDGEYPESMAYIPWLTAGTHSVQLAPSGIVTWGDKRIAIDAVELHAIDGTDADGNGIADWIEALLSGGIDSDGDGITDFEEISIHLTDPLNADSDGDGWSDADELAFGTNPLQQDTDLDGVDDWTEREQALSDPLTADFGERTNVISINGSGITGSVGDWIKEGYIIYSVGINGSLDYSIDVPADGHYAVEFEIADHSTYPGNDPFDLTLAVDGVAGRSVLRQIPDGGTATALFFPPYLTSGEHSFKLIWSNLDPAQKLEVRSVRLVAYDGSDADGNGRADWIDRREAHSLGVINVVPASPVSPVCIEGSSLFVDLLSISNTFAFVGTSASTPLSTGNHWVSVRNSINRGWYANAPLSPAEETQLSLAHNGSTSEQMLTVDWEETNLMATPTNQVTIRINDALLFNVLPNTGKKNKKGSMVVTIDGPTGITNLVSLTDQPIPYIFEEAGIYIVSGFSSKSRAVHFDENDPVNAYGFRNGIAANGVYNNGNTSTSAVFTVEVVDYRFSGNPSCLKDSQRSWDCPDIAEETVIEQDGTLELVRNPLDGGGTLFELTSPTSDEQCMIARLGEGGPITDHALVNTITEYSGEYYRIVEEFADGSNLIELTLSFANIPDDFQMVLEIFVGGVTFLDGTVEKEFTKADFNEQGVLKVLMVNAAGKQSDCHRVKIFQGDKQL